MNFVYLILDSITVSRFYVILTIVLVKLSIACNFSNNEFNVAPVFSDQMVLQQNQSNPIWGTSPTNSQIIITTSWGEKIKTSTDNKGHWIVYLNTPKFNESIKSYSIKITNGKKTIIINDVLIGEVWLASGQSNMQWKMNECENCVINQDYEIKNSKNEYIRMFSVPQDFSGERIKSAKWMAASPSTTGKFSAAAYYFSKKLYNKLGTPIGIINTSWGGTRVEAWMSPRKLNLLDETKSLIPEDYSFFGSQDYIKVQNDSLEKVNAKKYGYNYFPLPFPFNVKKWEELDLLDISYKDLEFDDSFWEKWDPNFDTYNLTSGGRFEAVFDESDPLISNGTIWFRSFVSIPDSSTDYFLHVRNGIDDSDQTFFNGTLIGNTFDPTAERNYIIPKKIIKKGKNLISFRITDYGGPGGFNSPVIIQNKNNVIKVPFESFKFKHHGFVHSGSIIVHNHKSDELNFLSEKNKSDIKAVPQLLNQNGFSAMYETMLSPVIPYGIKGVIWYQGEENVRNYQEYTNLFSAMIEDWRFAWSSDNLPFYFAQIAPFKYDKSQTSQGLRDSQRKILDKVKNTGMAVLLDIGEENDIHPENKKDVGERLALHALKNQYNFDLVANGPLYKVHVVKGSYIEVSFDNTANGLLSKGKLKGFEIANSDGVFYPAIAKIKNNKIIVSSKKVRKPVHVRYGWENWFNGPLFNSEGLPASSFSSL